MMRSKQTALTAAFWQQASRTANRLIKYGVKAVTVAPDVINGLPVIQDDDEYCMKQNGANAPERLAGTLEPFLFLSIIGPGDVNRKEIKTRMER